MSVTRQNRSIPNVELNNLTDEILIRIFIYTDFKTKHNVLPLVCKRWAAIIRSNELWQEVKVVPSEEKVFCGGSISQSKVFRWCSQVHVRPVVKTLKLTGLGSEYDDFTPVGLGALFGICCAALTKLELQATRTLLSDLSSLLCCFNLIDLSLVCVDPDPLVPFHVSDAQCIAGLTQLEYLVFDLNLAVIPGELHQLEKLKSLVVSGTGNASLIFPSDLSSLTQLEVLIVKKPMWSVLPSVIYNLPKLSLLDIRGHPLFAHNIKFCSSATKMMNLKRLGIVAHQLQKAPEEVGDMVFLRDLDLSWNSFDERLPTEVVFPFRKLIRLEKLSLSNCGLTQLPSILQWLVSLRELDLSGNIFTSMSNVLSQCLHLKILALKNCNFHAVPNEVSDIPNLEHLDISNNPIVASDGLITLLKRKKFTSLVFRQEHWSSELVMSACRMARMWGKREPIVS